MKYNFDKLTGSQNSDSVKWGCGHDFIPMGIADMDFETVPEVREAIIERAGKDVFGYTELPKGYRESVTGWILKRHQWKVKKEWLTISPGIVTAITLAIRAFAQNGDKVLVQSPVYYPFFSAITRSGCEIIENQLSFSGGRYGIDFEDLEKKAADERAKILILCNPHNPVGRVWTREELMRIGGICLKNNVMVIADEIHSDLVYSGSKYTPFASISKEFEQNSITCTAPSKTFNLAGLQTSNIIIPNEKLRREYNISLENTGMSRLNLFGGIACKAAYTHGEQWLEEVLEYIGGNKEFAIRYIGENIPEIKVIEPEGTYLLWIDFRKLGLDSESLRRYLQHETRIIFNEGYVFGQGGQGFERMNIACPRSVLEEALGRIEKAVRKIRI
jgi:cysteine-S-conjugate beta-lyase